MHLRCHGLGRWTRRLEVGLRVHSVSPPLTQRDRKEEKERKASRHFSVVIRVATLELDLALTRGQAGLTRACHFQAEI